MGDVRWLTAEEQEVWRVFVTAVDGFKDHMDKQLQRDSAMPYTYYEILVTLSHAPNRTMRMSELAGKRGASRSRLSHAAARLEELGWVRRQACPTDKRGAFAVLTEEGYEALADAAPGHVTAVREQLFDQLTPEQVRMLGEISTAILTGLAGVPGSTEDPCR